MTWTLYWTVIGIVYPLYYVLNIAYDLLSSGMINRESSINHSTTYDVSHLFETSISPHIVSVEPYDAEGLSPFFTDTSHYEAVESQNMTVDEFLEEVNKKNADRVSSIFS